MSHPTDALPDWLLEDPTPAEPRRSSPRLLALATLPWVVVLALVLPRSGPDAPTPLPAPDPALPTEAPADAADADAHDPAAAPLPTGDEPVTGDAAGEPGTDQTSELLWAVEHPVSYRLRPGPEEAAALAVAVARAWLTGLEPTLAIDGLAPPQFPRYAEHLVVEAVEPVAGDLTVVTVLAVLLAPETDADAGGEIEVRRLAVPVATTRDGTRPAGSPWWLPEPTLAVLRPALDAPLGPEERHEATLALERVGFAEVTIDDLHAVGPTVAVATARATTPAGEQVDGEIWLRRHLHGFAVTGAPLHPGRAIEQEDLP